MEGGRGRVIGTSWMLPTGEDSLNARAIASNRSIKSSASIGVLLIP